MPEVKPARPWKRDSAANKTAAKVLFALLCPSFISLLGYNSQKASAVFCHILRFFRKKRKNLLQSSCSGVVYSRDVGIHPTIQKKERKRMKEWRRVLSCFLAVLLTVYLVPVQVMAEELGDLWPPTTENVVDAPAEVVGEILEQREENRKEFLLTDGTRQVVIYPAAVHYQKDGYWEEIDNRLLPSAAQDGETVYRNAAGMWDVSVPAELNTANGITVSRSGYSLSFYLTGQLYEDDGAISESGSGYIGEELPGEDMICVPADESAAEVSSIASTLADEGQLQPEAALNNQRSETVYQDVYHDTDVTYDLDSNRLKESLILRSCPKELLGYRYHLEAENLRLELQEDNRILAYAKDADSEAKPVFYMPASYLLDAENVCSDDIKVILEENEKGYELRYYLPQDWMADASYPVVLDPVVQPVSNTFTIWDKTVSQRNSELAGSAYIAATTCSSSRRTSGGKSNAPRQTARGRNTGPVRMTV